MTHDAPDVQRLLNAKQTASTLNISARLLWSLTVGGEIPYCRIRRRVLYDPSDLACWIQQHKTRQPLQGGAGR